MDSPSWTHPTLDKRDSQLTQKLNLICIQNNPILITHRHIQEHMAVPMDTSQMSERELQFHYFKMYDADNNNKLDGCELVKSIIHWHGK